MYIFGKNSIYDLYKKDPKQIKEIYISSKRHQSFYIEIKKNKNIILKSFNEFNDKSININKVNHQEIIAKINEPTLLSLQELIYKNKNISQPIILILDHINDSFNFGAIIRNVSAFGGNGIIFPNKNSAKLNAGVIKASAGTWVNVDLVEVSNISTTINKLKEEGYWIVSTTLDTKKDLSTLNNFDKPLAIILGNEEKGIRNQILKQSDFKVKIDIHNETESLNVSSTSAILLFHLKNNF